MFKYKYKGIDSVKGKKTSGYLEGYTKEEILYKLKENDIEVEEENVYEIDEDSFEYKLDLLLNKDLSNPIKKKHILTFTEQLSMHLSAKLPVSESLNTMSKDSTNGALAKLYKQLYEDSVKGLDLSESLSKHPAFDDFFLTIVKSGEQSGHLDEALRSLNDFIKTNARLKNRLLFAMMYPIFLLVVMIGGLIALSYFLIPKFQKIFADQGVELNVLTKFYFGLADFLRYHPFMTLGIVFGITSIILFYIKSKHKKMIQLRGYVELKNPIYNKFFKDRQIAQFAFTLSILMKNGIILTDALEMSKNMFTNQYVLEGINKIHKNLMQGSPLNKEMKDFKIFKKQFLPVLFVQLATAGEATGNLEEPFHKVGDYFTTMFDNKASALEKIMEPLLLVCIMPPVFTFVLAIFLPMINLGSALQ